MLMLPNKCETHKMRGLAPSMKSRAALAAYKETPQRSEMTTRDCCAWAKRSGRNHNGRVPAQAVDRYIGAEAGRS